MRNISIYTIDETPIGTGGIGCVYRGTDQQGREVAIKEIIPELAEQFKENMRFMLDTQILQHLNRDDIVKVYNMFPMGDYFYIVMELVDGLTLEQYVQKHGPLSYQQTMRIMEGLLNTMQLLHEQQLVHRDIKPTNIMIRNDGSVCILDFGMSHILSRSAGHRTICEIIGGFSPYMSPEEARGMAVDRRSDIYSLGCVCYYMLTGHHAVEGLKDYFEHWNNNISEDHFPRLLKYSKKAYPKGLQEVLDHAINPNMMKRYQSCREFRKNLKSLEEETEKNTKNTKFYKRFMNMTKRLMRMGLLIVALMGFTATVRAQQTAFTERFTEIQPKEIEGDVFTMTEDVWAVVTAGTPGDFNSMVASWGGWGILMNKPVAWLCLSAERYTLEKMRQAKTYTMAYLPAEYKQQVMEFGNKSGRDTDKMKQTTLHPIVTPAGNVAYDEAQLIIELQLEEITTVNSKDFQSAESQKFFEERHQAVGDYHKLVVGFITHVWKKK